MLLHVSPDLAERLVDTLLSPHERWFQAAILDRRGRVIRDVSHRYMDGTTTGDDSGDTTRSTTCQLIDPRHELGFDADTYQGGDLDLSRQLRVRWVIDGPLLARPFSWPVHTGPVTRLQRQGPVVSVEAQGKEVYGLARARKTRKFAKGMKRTDVIRAILREFMGETRMRIPDLPQRLPDDVHIRPSDQPVKRALKVGQSLGRQLYWPSDGIPTLRQHPDHPTWSFDDDDGGLMSDLDVAADLQEVRNQVKVIGYTPKNKKQPISDVVTAPVGHPLHPVLLGPPGAPQYLQEQITNNHARSKAECRKIGEQAMARKLRLLHDLTFSGVPVPWIEIGDLVRASTAFEATGTLVDSFNLPHREGPMTIGWARAYKLRRRKA